MRRFYRNRLTYNDKHTYRTCRARCPHVEPLHQCGPLVNSSLNYADQIPKSVAPRVPVRRRHRGVRRHGPGIPVRAPDHNLTEISADLERIDATRPARKSISTYADVPFLRKRRLTRRVDAPTDVAL